MSYSRWVLTDLQVHTPSDKAHRYGDVGQPYPNIAFAESLVRAHAAAGVRIFAVTDHNRIDWWPALHDAGKRLGVFVYPGIEINVNKCHLLMIWDRGEEGYQLARHFLAGLFPAGTSPFLSNGHPRPVESGSPRDKAKEAVEAHALVFAPHSTTKDIGLFARNVCNTSASLAQSGYISGFDVYGSAGAEVLRNPAQEFGQLLPTWFISGDTRSLEDVGKRAVYLKVGDPPTLESIRQAFLMPGTRIRFPEALRDDWGRVKHVQFLQSPQPSWSRIGRVRIEGGFHGGLDVTLGPGLNAIIGGKGTGKSTLVEVLRYVLEAPPSIAPRAAAAEALTNREVNFPPNAEAVVEYSDGAGETYEVSRVGGSAGACLTRSGVTVEVDINRRIRPRVFGQRELAELQKQPGALRAFVASQTHDAARGIDQRIGAASHSARALSNEMATLEKSLARTAEADEELADLSDRLTRLAESGAEALVRESQQLTEAADAVERLLGWPARVAAAVAEAAAAAEAPELPTHPLLPVPLVSARDTAASTAPEALAEAGAAIEKIQRDLVSAATGWPGAWVADPARQIFDHEHGNVSAGEVR